jgi:hypothetical protein
MPIDSHLPQADPFSLVPTFKYEYFIVLCWRIGCFFHEVWDTTENREYCTHIYRNILADLLEDDSRISVRVAHTFSPATVPVVFFCLFLNRFPYTPSAILNGLCSTFFPFLFFVFLFLSFTLFRPSLLAAFPICPCSLAIASSFQEDIRLLPSVHFSPSSHSV